MTEIEVNIGEGTYTAKMIGKPYEGYKGNRLEPPEPPECEFMIEDQYGVEIDLGNIDDDKYWEIEDKLINTYYDDMADRKAEDRLNKIRGK